MTPREGWPACLSPCKEWLFSARAARAATALRGFRAPDLLNRRFSTHGGGKSSVDNNFRKTVLPPGGMTLGGDFAAQKSLLTYCAVQYR
jgi:hypothetical protein